VGRDDPADFLQEVGEALGGGGGRVGHGVLLV
jgi:hypothetical protein